MQDDYMRAMYAEIEKEKISEITELQILAGSITFVLVLIFSLTEIVGPDFFQYFHDMLSEFVVFVLISFSITFIVSYFFGLTK